jgi:hypothetical protein
MFQNAGALTGINNKQKCGPWGKTKKNSEKIKALLQVFMAVRRGLMLKGKTKISSV